MTKLPLVLLMLLSFNISFAQHPHDHSAGPSFPSAKEKHGKKPQLFSKVSQKNGAAVQQLEQIVSFRVGQQVNIQVTPSFTVSGTVSAKTNDAPGLHTVIIHSSGVAGMVFSVSRVQIPGEGIQYRGLIMSNGHSDMLLLEKDAVTGTYAWNKKSIAQMIPD